MGLKVDVCIFYGDGDGDASCSCTNGKLFVHEFKIVRA